MVSVGDISIVTGVNLNQFNNNSNDNPHELVRVISTINHIEINHLQW